MLTLVSLTHLSCFEKSINCTQIVELTNLLVEESFIIHNTGERFCLFGAYFKDPQTWAIIIHFPSSGSDCNFVSGVSS